MILHGMATVCYFIPKDLCYLGSWASMHSALMKAFAPQCKPLESLSIPDQAEAVLGMD